MFFPKLLKRAKWIFLFLGVVFGLSFVFMGVGTGLPGANPIDALQGLFQEKKATQGPSVEDAREKARQNPKDAKAQLQLANALQAAGETEAAIAALERYTKMRPRDTSALQQLAALYDSRAREAQERASAAQLEAQQYLFPQTIQPAATPLAQELSEDQFAATLGERANRTVSEAVQEMQTAYASKAAIYRKLSRLLPDDPGIFLQLGQAAQFAGDYQGAIAAYKRFLTLAPDDPNAAIVRREIKRLQGAGGSG